VKDGKLKTQGKKVPTAFNTESTEDQEEERTDWSQKERAMEEVLIFALKEGVPMRPTKQ
jgi:hypothetical protein